MPRHSNEDLDRLYEAFCCRLIGEQIRAAVNELPTTLRAKLPLDFSPDLTSAIQRKLLDTRILRRPYGFDGTVESIVGAVKDSQRGTLGFGHCSTSLVQIQTERHLSSPQPSVGCIVYFTEFDDRPAVPGVVTAVNNSIEVGTVCLYVFPAVHALGGVKLNIPFSVMPKAGHWSWHSGTNR